MKKRYIVGGVIAAVLFAAVACNPTTPTAPAAPSTAPAAPVTTSPAPPPTETPPAGVGSEVRDGDFAFVVTDVRTGVRTVGEGILAETAQGAYTIVTVTVTNTGDRAQMFDGSSQKLRDAGGREFSSDGSAAIYLPDSQSFLNDINPGNTVTAKVVFDVPVTAQPTVLELHDSPFSGGVAVAV